MSRSCPHFCENETTDIYDLSDFSLRDFRSRYRNQLIRLHIPSKPMIPVLNRIKVTGSATGFVEGIFAVVRTLKVILAKIVG